MMNLFTLILILFFIPVKAQKKDSFFNKNGGKVNLLLRKYSDNVPNTKIIPKLQKMNNTKDDFSFPLNIDFFADKDTETNFRISTAH